MALKKLINRGLLNQSIVCAEGTIKFDEQGEAMVSENLADALSELHGFELDQLHSEDTQDDSEELSEEENDTEESDDENEEDNEDSYSKESLQAMTVNQLRRLATQNSIEVPNTYKKEQIVELLAERI